MKTILIATLSLLISCTTVFGKKKQDIDHFPDGTPIPAWFSNAEKVNFDSLGKRYVITEHGVSTDASLIQTEQIQKVIDKAASEGGGVIVIPTGTFLSGSLFFKPGTHLYIERGGTLMGSDRIRNFKLVETRIEGQTINYFAALVNADGCDGFTMGGEGTINGNGHNYWEEFWIRRKFNKECTNLEALRPRLVYISNSKNVTVQDINLINSPFWTNHLYRCENVRYLDCYIFAPTSGVKAPSSDAIDLDVCKNVLIKDCYMSVNDDAVVLKGGKGTYADKNPNNGPCSNIIIEDCTYGKVHGCLTLGSESIHDRNIILRRCKVGQAQRVLWLKMRPDTPQHYEYITVEDITGTCQEFLTVRPWTQFYKKENRPDMPLSKCNNITLRNIKMDCNNFFNVGASDKYKLTDFTFENIHITGKQNAFPTANDIIENIKTKNVKIETK